MTKSFLKKSFVLVLLLIASVLVFVGCSKDSDESGSKTKKTVITYCNWNFGTEEENNLTRRMVEAFNKQSDTIRIDMIVPSGTYDEFLTVMASGGDLPDVFMVNSVPTTVINQWAYDLTDLTKNDEEWANVSSVLRDSITYNGHVYAIPSGQYYMGLFANLDLIDDNLKGGKSAEEMFYPGAFTTEEWIETVKAMKKTNVKDGTGTIGMNAVGDMINWLPGVLDKTGKLQAFVWDGTKFDFQNQALFDAFDVIADLGGPNAQYVFDAIPEKIGEGDDAVDNRSLIFGPGGSSDVFKNGQMGFIQEGSWAGAYENVKFNCMFTSYPDKRVVVATDYFCINKSTKNPEAAYEVAKFLTFGEKGAYAMFDILDNNKDAGLSLTCIPPTTKKEIVDKWFSYIKMRGLHEVFDEVEKGNLTLIVEGNKYVPGFLKARYHFQTGLSFENVRGNALLTIGDFIWETCNGNISINDFKSSINQSLIDQINKLVKDDYEAMGLEYNG